MQVIQQTFEEDFVLLNLDADDLTDIFRSVTAFLSGKKRIQSADEGIIRQALLKREQEISTAIGHAIAVPHAYLPEVPEPTIVFVRLKRPLNLGAPDGIPTRFVFVLLGPEGYAAEHLDTLTSIARVTSDVELRDDLDQARDAADLIRALAGFRERSLQEKALPELSVPEELKYSGRICGGLIADIRRRVSVYASDISDGLSGKVLASVVFLFFACLAPAVTFGGIMGEQTGNQIGAVEMLIASAVCGVIYAVFAGQPLIILGGIGPTLVFTAILYRLCADSVGASAFLPVYACVGLWTAFFLMVMSVTEASRLMKFFTRFTDEIFAALMSLIFIWEAGRAIYMIFDRSFAAEQNQSHDTAFLSLLLAVGTVQIALSLSGFRRSRFLSTRVREFLSDFGPTISIAAMGLIAWLLRGAVELDQLNAPEGIRPSFTIDGSPRSWFVSPLDAPVWTWFAAAAPAALAAVLIFLAQNITARIVNAPEHHLTKGSAYHLDLLVVGALIAACSLFGMPWLCAATVRSMAHVRGLANIEEVVSRSGDPEEHIIGVRENRVSALVIHLLMGCSLLLLPLLSYVPMAVLYGLFLYMGIVSMRGNQFLERAKLFVMDKNLYPQTYYIRRASNSSLFRYTAIQMTCLVVLFAVSLVPYQVLRITFPLLIALLVPVRFFIARWFSPADLGALDAREQPSEMTNDWGV